MNHRISTVILAAAMLCGFFACMPATVFAADSWTTITPAGTTGYVLNTTKAMGSYVFLGTDHGVYRSANSGGAWSTVNTGLVNTNVTAVAIGWVYDGGLGQYTSSASTVVLVGTSAGISRGTMAGASWTAAVTGPSGAVKDLEFDQSEATQGIVGHAYAATTAGIYRSDDSGANWTLQNTGIGSNKSMAKIVTDFTGGVIYALSSTGELYSSAMKSVSGVNESWSLVKAADAGAHDISILNPLGGISWMARSNGILKSDGATTWSDHSGDLSSVAVRSVESDYTDSNVSYAATAQGVWRTTNEALSAPQWLPIPLDLADQDIREVKANPADSLSVYALGAGLYKLSIATLYDDLTAPSAVSDLAAVTVDSDTLRLDWTAPGNDGAYGTADTYEMRYSTSGTITDTNWNGAGVNAISAPATHVSGTAEHLTFTKPDSSPTYYFAIESVDAAGNRSAISNVASTVAPGDTDPPQVSSVASSTTSTSATVTWTTDENADSQVDYGPTTSYTTSTTLDPALVTSHSVAITGLTTNSVYHFRIRTTDSSGNGTTTMDYTFMTAAVVAAPIVTTDAASSIASLTATLNGSVTVTGGSNPTQHGFAYGTDPALRTVRATTTLGSQAGTGSFSSSVSSLSCGTTYFYRAYATNPAGTGFGSITSVSTTPCATAPVLTVQSASQITTTGATLNGTITDTGNVFPTVRGFAYGVTAAYGATTNESGSFSNGAYASQGLTNLACGTLYHVAAYATNIAGTGYSGDSSFTTSVCLSPGNGGGGGGGGGSSGGGTVVSSGGGGSSAPAATVSYSSPTAAQNPLTVSILSCIALTRSMTVGSTGADVKLLQQFLNGRGFAVSASGPGSKGLESAYFGNATAAAVARFQVSVGITPSAGHFGPITMAKVNSLNAAKTCPSSSASAPTGVAVPTATVSSPRSTYARNLTLGSTGADVKALQVFLNAKRFKISASGGGSPGHETMYFGPATRSALARYQSSMGISPAIGYFGTKTRHYVAAHQ